MELSFIKWLGGTSLLDGRTQEDHVSGPPGGPKNFSSFGIGGKVGANREREDKLANSLVWAING